MEKKCNYPIKAELSLELYYDIIKIFDAFKEQNVLAFPRDGMLLGIVRHRGFLPFDVDPDLGILSEDYEKLKKMKFPEGYMLKNNISSRNLKYKTKYGKPYDFSIIKKNKKYKTLLYILYFVVTISFFIIIFLNLKIFFKLILLFVLIIITILIYEYIHRHAPTVLDGTVFHTDDGENYFQEIEWNETGIANEHYGNTSKYYTYKKSDIKPLELTLFYDYKIPVPRNSKTILKHHYGKDVFDFMFRKEDSVIEKLDLTNCYCPPAILN